MSLTTYKGMTRGVLLEFLKSKLDGDSLWEVSTPCDHQFTLTPFHESPQEGDSLESTESDRAED